ncbi:hypothetical protein VP1G_10303 [Cytospora mali]|uniref:Uncharacterized protein n=1 Tax=Cytospora mali TaxID=578113 RepID=A0A194VH27_CYTMA|nr:hypothetical protein VP1G_10303 [Valsa mali var. pyri (nom. inval.)]
MATTPFLTTVSGTATSLVPLPTAWTSAGADCGEAIYQQIGGNFLAWDPWYVHYIDGDLTTCWPPQASSWWNQDSSPSTSLGPTFVCPGAYHPAYTSSVGSQTTKTICCPSGYNLYVADFDRTIFPSQCTSTVTAGATLDWEKIYYDSAAGDTWSTTSTTVQSDILTIFGIPVNGFNVVATSTTTSSTGSTDTDSGTSSSSARTMTTASSSVPSSSSSSSGSTSVVGVAVGASVGAVVGVLLVAVGAFLVWRRRRRGGSSGRGTEGPGSAFKTAETDHHPMMGYYAPAPIELKGSHPGAHELSTESVHELSSGRDGNY